MLIPKWPLSVTSQLMLTPAHFDPTGQCDIWIRVDHQQPSCGRLSNVHHQPIGATEWNGGGAGTNVPEGEFDVNDEFLLMWTISII